MFACQVLLLNSIPAVRSRYIIYGSRAIQVRKDDPPRSRRETSKSAEKHNANATNNLEWFFERLGAIRVPHTWFQHFYLVSVLSSLFWGLQILAKGSAFETLCQSIEHNTQAKGMTTDQVVLSWSLVTTQGVRRLLETSLLARSSESKMWFIHWLVGIAFYLAIGIACWIEGAGM